MSDLELNSLVLQLVALSQDLVTAKLRLESGAKSGWLQMAQARYKGGLGPGAISSLQLPSGDQEVLAEKRVNRDECVMKSGVRYFHHSLMEKEQEEEGLKRRKPEKNDTGNIALSPRKSNDPIKWFGILTPTSLKQSQIEFLRCVDVVVEIANIQSEIQGVQARIKYLQRLQSKQLKLDDENKEELETVGTIGEVENLDSCLQNSLKVEE